MCKISRYLLFIFCLFLSFSCKQSSPQRTENVQLFSQASQLNQNNKERNPLVRKVFYKKFKTKKKVNHKPESYYQITKKSSYTFSEKSTLTSSPLTFYSHSLARTINPVIPQKKIEVKNAEVKEKNNEKIKEKIKEKEELFEPEIIAPARKSQEPELKPEIKKDEEIKENIIIDLFALEKLTDDKEQNNLFIYSKTDPLKRMLLNSETINHYKFIQNNEETFIVWEEKMKNGYSSELQIHGKIFNAKTNQIKNIGGLTQSLISAEKETAFHINLESFLDLYFIAWVGTSEKSKRNIYIKIFDPKDGQFKKIPSLVDGHLKRIWESKAQIYVIKMRVEDTLYIDIYYQGKDKDQWITAVYDHKNQEFKYQNYKEKNTRP